MGAGLQRVVEFGSLCVLRVRAAAREAVVRGEFAAARRGEVVRAGNQIGNIGTASLAPILLRMTRLTLLDLSGMLLAPALTLRVSACSRRLCMDNGCALRAVAGGGVC